MKRKYDYYVHQMQELKRTRQLIRITEQFNVMMNVNDVKSAYGVPRLLVTPTDGNGQAWVNLDKMIIPEEEGGENDGN